MSYNYTTTKKHAQTPKTRISLFWVLAFCVSQITFFKRTLEL